MKKKITYIVFTIISSLGYLYPQETIFPSYLYTQIPSSPQSKIFEKYLNHEITEYNGIPNISIPLYSIEIKGLTIPISLSYHAAGIKYQQYDGDIGAGWSIGCTGYRISRTIYGKPDEKYPMCNPSVLNSLTDQSLKDAFLASISTHRFSNTFNLSVTNGKYQEQDGEYDIFSFILPSTNGHFIIKDIKNKDVTILEKTSEIIQIDKNLDKLSITDQNGFRYYMGLLPNGKQVVEYTSPFSSMGSEKMAWPVKQIVSPDGQSIDFKYSTYKVPLYTYPNFLSIGASFLHYTHSIQNTTLASGGPMLEINPYKEMLFLEEINTEKETVHFIRQKQGDYPYLLKKIEIKDKRGNIIKVFNFTQKLESKTLSGSKIQEYSHHLLSSINSTDKDKKEIDIYQFEYYLPTSEVYPDLWGYYKSGDIKSRGSFPGLFLDDQMKDEAIISEIDNYNGYVWRSTLKNYIAQHQISWLNRFINLMPNYFSLRKITFPTGGSTEYVYEPNKYSDGTQSIVFGNGQRIKKIISYPENSSKKDTIVTDFKYGINENGLGTVDIPLTKEHFVQESFSIIYTPVPFITDPTPRHIYTMTPSKTFSMTPKYSDLSNIFVQYSQITTYKTIFSNPIKKTKKISSYNIPRTYESNRWASMARLGGSRYPNLQTMYYDGELISKYRLSYKPTVKDIKLYDTENVLVKETSFYYEKDLPELYYGIKTSNIISADQISIGNHIATNYHLYQHMSSFFNSVPYSIEVGKEKLQKETEITYFPSSQTSVKSSIEYLYNKYGFVSKKKEQSSTGSNIIKEYKYPFDYPSDLGYSDLVSKNIISQPIEEIKYVEGKEVYRLKKNYYYNMLGTIRRSFPLNIMESFSGEKNLKEIESYQSHDYRDNPVECTNKEGLKVFYFWNDEGKIIAEIKNATKEQVQTALNGTLPHIFSPIIEESDYKILASLRTSLELKNALITTYTYQPLVGMTSMTDPRGVTTTYEYDSFGRLAKVKDMNGKVIQSYDYHYQNQ